MARASLSVSGRQASHLITRALTLCGAAAGLMGLRPETSTGPMGAGAGARAGDRVFLLWQETESVVGARAGAGAEAGFGVGGMQ